MKGIVRLQRQNKICQMTKYFFKCHLLLACFKTNKQNIMRKFINKQNGK